MNPETAEQKKWYLLGIVHQLVREYADDFKLDYHVARKLVIEYLIAELERKEER